MKAEQKKAQREGDRVREIADKWKKTWEKEEPTNLRGRRLHGVLRWIVRGLAGSEKDKEIEEEHGMEKKAVDGDVWGGVRLLHATGRRIWRWGTWRLKTFHLLVKAAVCLTSMWNGACSEESVHDALIDNTFTSLASASAMLELARFPNSPGSRLVLGLLEPLERRGFKRERGKGDKHFSAAVQSLVRKQVRAISRPPDAQDRAFVYVWNTNLSRYVGRTASRRKQYRKRTGPVWRFNEHVRNTFSHTWKERFVKKYKTARRAEWASFQYLVVREGTAREVEAMEQLAIN